MTSDKAKSRLNDYIKAVIGRYRGKIPSWDVVNEAVDDAQNNTNPQAKLYYNDYNIEGMGSKANSAFQLITWARSQGTIIHGVGLQWHVGLWAILRSGDQYYQNVQRLIDNGFEFMKQGLVYHSFVKYVLHFSSNCRAFITWGFTDRYSWIPSFSNYRNGAPLPSDESYLPKPAYWQMQEELARVLSDDTYRLAPQSKPNKCFDTYDRDYIRGIQIYNTGRNQSNQIQNCALDTYNEKAAQERLQAYRWWGGHNQRWIFSPVGANNFCLAPRTVWWRALTTDGTSSVVIDDYVNSADQHWTLTKV
ncbi:unnamed protein product [Rotaria sp. Silwood2]|nr:unnamed protein product [Rotaria sp. Silwood2]